MKTVLLASFAALGFFVAAGTASAAYWSYPCSTMACNGAYGYGQDSYGYGNSYGYGYAPYQQQYQNYNYPSSNYGYGGGYYPQQQWAGYAGSASSYASSGIGSFSYQGPQILVGGYGNNYASPYMSGGGYGGGW